MAISSTVSNDGREITIKVDGRFDFSAHQSFRDAYSQADPSSARYVIDMTRTEYIDSSALGMLLLLRQRAGGDGDRIRLFGCTTEVSKILQISRFDRLFQLDCRSAP